jgi:hypothetical protein
VAVEKVLDFPCSESGPNSIRSLTKAHGYSSHFEKLLLIEQQCPA